MAKYDPLERHLREDGRPVIRMTFDEIAAVVPLPKSARKFEAWWSNEDVRSTRHMQCKAWQNAGYEADLDMLGRTVSFRRAR